MNSITLNEIRETLKELTEGYINLANAEALAGLNLMSLHDTATMTFKDMQMEVKELANQLNTTVTDIQKSMDQIRGDQYANNLQSSFSNANITSTAMQDDTDINRSISQMKEYRDIIAQSKAGTDSFFSVLKTGHEAIKKSIDLWSAYKGIKGISALINGGEEVTNTMGKFGKIMDFLSDSNAVADGIVDIGEIATEFGGESLIAGATGLTLLAQEIIVPLAMVAGAGYLAYKQFFPDNNISSNDTILRDEPVFKYYMDDYNRNSTKKDDRFNWNDDVANYSLYDITNYHAPYNILHRQLFEQRQKLQQQKEFDDSFKVINPNSVDAGETKFVNDYVNMIRFGIPIPHSIAKNYIKKVSPRIPSNEEFEKWQDSKGFFDSHAIKELPSWLHNDHKMSDHLGLKHQLANRTSAHARVVGHQANTTISIKIDSLVKNFEVKTTTLNASAAKVKDIIAQVLLQAVNDSQIMADG